MWFKFFSEYMSYFVGIFCLFPEGLHTCLNAYPKNTENALYMH